MQEEQQDLSNLSAEAVRKAIESVRARAWDINPFTVADELKVSRSAVYRHAEIMKLIIDARGGGFGMDVQTSLDLAWQLRQLEQQNLELREKLAISGSHKKHEIAESIPKVGQGPSMVITKEPEKGLIQDNVFNFANSTAPMSYYFNQLASMSWKDIETVYYFRVASLKDYAKNLFANGDNLPVTNGSAEIEALAPKASTQEASISYGSLVRVEADKRQKQAGFNSPFARLKETTVSSGDQAIKTPSISERLNPIVPVAPNEIGSGKDTKSKIRTDDLMLPLERLTGDHPAVEPLEYDQSEKTKPESTKRVDKFAADMTRVVADLHRDLASKIRAGLTDTGSELAMPEQVNKLDSTPKSESDGWVSFEQAKTDQSIDWQGVSRSKLPIHDEEEKKESTPKAKSKTDKPSATGESKRVRQSGEWQSISGSTNPMQPVDRQSISGSKSLVQSGTAPQGENTFAQANSLQNTGNAAPPAQANNISGSVAQVNNQNATNSPSPAQANNISESFVQANSWQNIGNAAPPAQASSVSGSFAQVNNNQNMASSPSPAQASNISGSFVQANDWKNMTNSPPPVQANNVSGSVAQANMANLPPPAQANKPSGAFTKSGDWQSIDNSPPPIQANNISGSVAQTNTANSPPPVQASDISGSFTKSGDWQSIDNSLPPLQANDIGGSFTQASNWQNIDQQIPSLPTNNIPSSPTKSGDWQNLAASISSMDAPLSTGGGVLPPPKKTEDWQKVPQQQPVKDADGWLRAEDRFQTTRSGDWRRIDASGSELQTGENFPVQRSQPSVQTGGGQFAQPNDASIQTGENLQIDQQVGQNNRRFEVAGKTPGSDPGGWLDLSTQGTEQKDDRATNKEAKNDSQKGWFDVKDKSGFEMGNWFETIKQNSSTTKGSLGLFDILNKNQTTDNTTNDWLSFEVEKSIAAQIPGAEIPSTQAPIENKLPPDVPNLEPVQEPQIKLIPLLRDVPSTDEPEKQPEEQNVAGQMPVPPEMGELDAPDELRNLINSHIRNAAEQMAEFGHGHSIGSGKEFEVWLNNPSRSKFVGEKKGPEPLEEQPEKKLQEKNPAFKPRIVPPDVRKACLILGVRPDNISFEVVQDAWKKAIAAPGVHPDQGGDTELAVYLNTAKDVLMRFLDAQAPKLGKKFGPRKDEKENKSKADKSKP